jgi:hypothetical protein
LIIGYEMFSLLVVSEDDKKLADSLKKWKPRKDPKKKPKKPSAASLELERLKPEFRRYLQGGRN